MDRNKYKDPLPNTTHRENLYRSKWEVSIKSLPTELGNLTVDKTEGVWEPERMEVIVQTKPLKSTE